MNELEATITLYFKIFGLIMAVGFTASGCKKVGVSQTKSDSADEGAAQTFEGSFDWSPGGNSSQKTTNSFQLECILPKCENAVISVNDPNGKGLESASLLRQDGAVSDATLYSENSWLQFKIRYNRKTVEIINLSWKNQVGSNIQIRMVETNNLGKDLDSSFNLEVEDTDSQQERIIGMTVHLDPANQNNEFQLTYVIEIDSTGKSSFLFQGKKKLIDTSKFRSFEDFTAGYLKAFPDAVFTKSRLIRTDKHPLLGDIPRNGYFYVDSIDPKEMKFAFELENSFSSQGKGELKCNTFYKKPC